MRKWLWDIYTQRGIGVEQDFLTAKRWFEKAADKGDKVALYNLGSLYYNGTGIEKDYNTAFELCLKSAEMGYAPAQDRLSYLYANGEGERGRNKDYRLKEGGIKNAQVKGNYQIFNCYSYGCYTRYGFISANGGISRVCILCDALY
jgi:hypothetical protein